MFAEGSAHYAAHEWREALVAFERAYVIVQSPNTGLLIGRCLHELGRDVEAVEAFDRAAREAARRIAAGETKYAQAGDAATSEGEALRATLGTIRVHVAQRASPSTALTIDERWIPIDENGNASALHAPGAATVLFRHEGRVQKRTVNVSASATSALEFGADDTSARAPNDLRLPSDAPSRHEPTSSRPSWLLPTAAASGVVSLVGGGMYLGFNGAARSTYDDLYAKCGPNHCTDADRSAADRGESQQAVAIGSLVVGAVAAATAVALLVVHATWDDGGAAPSRRP